MTFDYTLMPEDFLAQVAFEQRFLRLPLSWAGWLIWACMFAALVIVSGDAPAWTVFVAVAAFLCLQATAAVQRRIWFRRSYSAERTRGSAGEQHVEVSESTLRETAPNRDVTWRWQPYSSIHQTASHVFIKPTPINTVIIPTSAFASATQQRELIELVQRYIESTKT